MPGGGRMRGGAAERRLVLSTERSAGVLDWELAIPDTAELRGC